MDSSAMDYTMQNPHHPHYHHLHHHPPSGVPASSALRCPALRANAGMRNHPSAATPPRGTAFYDPVHANASNRSHWQSRSPQRWQPAMIPPHSTYEQDEFMMGMLPALSEPDQPVQNLPPYAMLSHPDTFPYVQGIYRPPYRPTMPTQPVPRQLDQFSYNGPRDMANVDVSRVNSQHASSHATQRSESGLNASNPMLATPPASVIPLQPPRNPVQAAQDTYMIDENTRPREQTASSRLHEFLDQQESSSLPRRTPVVAASEENSPSRPSQSVSPMVSNPQQRPDATTVRANSLDEIHQGSSVRNRLVYRSANGQVHWSRDDEDSTGPNLSFLEFVEGHPGVRQEAESQAALSSPFRPQPMFRNSRVAKRVASKKALTSLQSVDVADLPESEKTCVICYNEFGVANPEGINEAPLRLPKCRHVFGDHCIKKWFEESDSCPYCRDKVHSESQPPRNCRPSGSVLRLMRQYQMQNQHMGFTRNSHYQNGSHGRSPSNLESTMDSYHMPSDIGLHSRPQPPNLRRYDGGMDIRPPHFAAPERRPISTDNENGALRARSRHNRSSRYNSVAGSPTTMSASGHTPVRLPRSSRSRSPVDHENSGARSNSHGSLMNSSQQFPRMNRSPRSPSQRDITQSQVDLHPFALWGQSPPFQPSAGSEELFQGWPPSTSNTASTVGQPITLPSLHPGPLPPRGPDFHSPEHIFPNHFASYQQS